MFTGWVDDSVFLQHAEHEDGVWINNYSQHAFTTGRRHISKSRFKGISHTMKVLKLILNFIRPTKT